MNISRDNYEEFFMLYADNELTASQKKEVDAFIAANPDLQQDLQSFEQFKLSPDANLVFDNKALLMKTANNVNIRVDNYESFFVLYADNELKEDEKAAVEDFVYRHPQFKSTFEMMQRTKLEADDTIVFENKETLYRKEKDDKVIPFPWQRIAAAIVLTGGLFWFYRERTINKPDVTVKTPPTVTKPYITPLQIKENTVNNAGGNKAKPAAEQVATVNADKENAPQKGIKPGHSEMVSVKKESKQTNPVIPDDISKVETGLASNNDKTNDATDKLTASNVIAGNMSAKKADIKIPVATAAAGIDEPMVINGGEDNKTNAEFASYNDNNIEVLNTSVNIKNPLRGFLRKASRIIARKTNTGNEDSNHKSILIGGFEIAVK